MGINYTKALSIVYACTKAEFDSGELEKSISRYISRKSSKTYSFDLFIIVDQGDEEHYAPLLDFESDKNINKITIHSLNLTDEENIYVKSKHSLKLFREAGEPELGLSAGPNNLFFGAMNYLADKDYENYLLLETDTRPVKYFWFDELYKYCVKNDFLIAGSQYKGNAKIPEDAEWKGHLNGVAIYKNCEKLKNLLSGVKSEIVRRVKEGNHDFFINYDIAIYYYTQSSESNKKEYKCVIDTDIITNISLGSDAPIREQDILTKYRKTIILHQKI